MSQLEEEVQLNKIKASVAQSRLEFRSNERNAEYVPSGKAYREVLKQAVSDLKDWENVVQNKTEMNPIPGRGGVSVPKRDDPYFKLHAQTVPYIIEVKKELDALETWLDAHQ